MDAADRLNECYDFSCIFELVKTVVELTIGRRRAGLMLGLSDLPIYIGAFHMMGSNFIIMNKRLLDRIVNTGDRKLINAYVFHVLLHEYIHSLGCIDEEQTHWLTSKISEKMLGLEHPATLIANYGIGSVLSNADELEHYEANGIENIELVEDFENDNLNYFG